MKLKIAVCEDNPEHTRHIRELAEHILFSRTEYEFTEYRNGAELVHAIEQNQFHSNLILLDIHMDGMDGMETVEWIRRYKVDVDVIFITVASEYVYQCYMYRAFAYILKPELDKHLEDVLNRYLDEILESSDYLNVEIRGSEHRIPLNEVLYFESNGRKLMAHLLTECIEFYGKIGELEEVLQEHQFFRCHQSYLVNKKYIKAIKSNGVWVREQEIPISRRYWNSYKNGEEG